MDELTQADLEAEFPRWHFYPGMNGLQYAQRMRHSPPVTLRGEDCTALRDEIRGWLGRNDREELPLASFAGHVLPERERPRHRPMLTRVSHDTCVAAAVFPA